MTRRFRRGRRDEKKEARALALKAVHYLDGKASVRRQDMVQSLQADGYTAGAVEDIIKKLHHEHLISVSRGRFSTVQVA